MINTLRKRIPIPDDLSDFLESGIELRNQIVHGFMTRNMLRIVDPKGRLEVECELATMKHEVKKRDVIINMLLDALFNKRGFTNEDLKQKAGEQWAYLNTPENGVKQ
jgi:hypothetical protein